MDDCAEARNFVEFVVSRETQLRDALYDQIANLQSELREAQNKLSVFQLAFGKHVGLFPPPLCPSFVNLCRDAQYDEIRAQSDALAFGRGVLSVQYFERVVRTYTDNKGFFTYGDMMRVLEDIPNDAVDITNGARFTWAQECLIVHAQR